MRGGGGGERRRGGCALASTVFQVVLNINVWWKWERREKEKVKGEGGRQAEEDNEEENAQEEGHRRDGERMRKLSVFPNDHRKLRTA
eukprot:1023310-Pyramimonas_sp.AAC.1